MLGFRSRFEVAINNFEIDSVKLLLEEVVRGYKADKDIVDPVWKQYRLIDVGGSGQEIMSVKDDKSIH